MLEIAVEMSLEEWKVIQEQSRPKAEFNIRKADTKLPPKAVVIHKSKRLKVIRILHEILQTSTVCTCSLFCCPSCVLGTWPWYD